MATNQFALVCVDCAIAIRVVCRTVDSVYANTKGTRIPRKMHVAGIWAPADAQVGERQDDTDVSRAFAKMNAQHGKLVPPIVGQPRTRHYRQVCMRSPCFVFKSSTRMASTSRWLPHEPKPKRSHHVCCIQARSVLGRFDGTQNGRRHVPEEHQATGGMEIPFDSAASCLESLHLFQMFLLLRCPTRHLRTICCPPMLELPL